MRAPVTVLALSLLSAAALGAPQTGAPSFVDTSESGEVFRFEPLPAPPGVAAEARLTTGPAAAWDVLSFEVRGAEPGSTLRFRMEDPLPGLAPEASAPEFRWVPARVLPSEPGELVFELEAPRERFGVRLRPAPAATPEAAYYTVGRFAEYYAEILAEPDAQVAQIGTSIQGRPLIRVVVDTPSPLPKKTVLMAVRQHGNEFGSSYLLEGALDLLLGRNGLTPEPELLDRVRWVIYPLVNPDGANANVRGNANGVDLNRDWRRAGASASLQEPETFAFQTDVQAFQELYGFDVGGDHHGWTQNGHGGYRYALGQSVSFVNVPQYDESKKHTEMYTLYDPTQTGWEENGGVTGMLRSEMFLRYGFLIHTPEYNSFQGTESLFYQKGQAWVRAMLDTLYAPRITDGDGVDKPFLMASGDALWVTVDDFDENQLPGEAETVSVEVRDERTGDVETLSLVEVGANSGIFRNGTGVPVVTGLAVPGNGRLETLGGSTVVARYVDDDYPADDSEGQVDVLPRRPLRPWF